MTVIQGTGSQGLNERLSFRGHSLEAPNKKLLPLYLEEGPRGPGGVALAMIVGCPDSGEAALASRVGSPGPG